MNVMEYLGWWFVGILVFVSFAVLIKGLLWFWGLA